MTSVMRVLTVITLSAVITLIAVLIGCGGGSTDVTNILSAPDMQNELTTPTASAWPAGLPIDAVQPWEEVDSNGNVIPSSRDYFGDKASTMINVDSVFTPGIERADDSTVGVSENGEALSLSAASGALSYAIYDTPLGGDEPGAISADVNLTGTETDNAYYLGLANYGSGRWEWHGPFTDNHVRIGTAQAVAAGASYKSPLGGVFVCVVAFDGASCDVVGISVNPPIPGDTTPPSPPTGLAITPVSGGLELEWDIVASMDLAGYQVYYSDAWFLDGTSAGVQRAGYLEGSTRQMLLGVTDTTHVRVAAIDLSGNESDVSDIENTAPLAGAPSVLSVTCTAPSGMVGDAITLTTMGFEIYDWDLNGDGIYEVLGDDTGTQQASTGATGLIRPLVRGINGGTMAACGGVSLLIGNNSRPLADGTALPAFGFVPLSVTFTGTGEDDDGTITGYAWDFNGDGTYTYTHATEPNPPAHLYDTPGTYNAKFRVEDNLGLTDIDTIAVNVRPTLNDPPTADLAVGTGEERGNAPHEVNFDASGSTDLDGTIDEYLWDFDGDGDYDEWTTTATATHTYTASGDYTAEVRVQDDDGAQDTATVVVSINYAPVADLTADVTEGDAPVAVNFDASGSDDPDGTIDDYEWDLDGDGVFNETGDEADARGLDTASHTYNDIGYYDAQVRVTDNEGLTDTATLAIIVRGWVILTIEDTFDDYDGQTTVLIVNGNPAILFSHYEAAQMYVRSNTATGFRLSDWGTPVQIMTGDLEYSSMAIVDGHPALSTYEYDDSDLIYIRSTTANGENAADWSPIVIVDESAPSPPCNPGRYTSLAVVDGNPAISYFESENDDLKYARSSTSTGSSAGDWSSIIVDSGDVGWEETSLCVVGGNPAIAYSDSTGADLKFARSTTSTGSSAGDWTQLVTVDSTGEVGAYAHLAIVDGNPAIAYYDNTNIDLKYARSTTSTGSSAGDWTQLVTVDSTGNVGDHTWLAIINGNPAICYRDNTNTDLKYVRAATVNGAAPGDWSGHVIVDDPDGGIHLSMIEINGSPAISYVGSNYDSIKYAFLVQ